MKYGENPGPDEVPQPTEGLRTTLRLLTVVAVVGAGLLTALGQAEDVETGAALLGAGALAALFVGLVAVEKQRVRLARIALASTTSLIITAVLVAVIDSDGAQETERAEPKAPTKVTDVSTGGRPRAAALSGTNLWVIGLHGRRRKGLLWKIDTAHLAAPAEAIESFKAVDPFDIAVGEHALWVTDNDDLIKLDLRGRQVWRRSYGKTSGDNEVEVAFRRVWFKRTVQPGEVLVLDPANGKRLDSVPIGREATAITSGLGAVWVSSRFANTPSVVRVEPTGRHGTTDIPVQADPQDMAVGERYVWVAHAEGNVVTRVDPVGGKDGKGQELPGDTRTHAELPSGVAAGGGSIWISNAGTGDVVAINPCNASRLGHAKAESLPTMSSLTSGAHSFRTSVVALASSASSTTGAHARSRREQRATAPSLLR